MAGDKIARAARERRPGPRTSMSKDLLTFPCPCCGKQIELDVRTGKARAVVPGEAKNAADIDQLLKAQQKEQRRLADVFDSAKQDQKKQSKTLEDLLDKAKDEAKKTPDKKVRRPWDLE